MRLTRRQSVGGLIAASLITPSAAVAADAKGYNGIWSGTLDLGAAKLRLKLDIRSASEAVLISIDQGGSAIPASAVSLGADKIEIAFDVIHARFEATLNDDTLSGIFSQGKTLPLSFKRGDLFAPSIEAKPIDAGQLLALLRASGAPAIGVAWRGPGSDAVRVAGLRAAGKPDAITPADLWHLGSITKSMTATLFARLTETGVANWDMTVGKILGEKVPTLQAGYQDVTFRHLLSHQSGLPGDIGLDALSTFSVKPLADARAERLRYAGLALAMPPVAAPGTKMLYANNGYIVAGAMMETLTGQAWETLIRKHVFVPLGLSSAGFGAPLTNQPRGHLSSPAGAVAVEPDGPTPADNPVALGPAGTVHMSLSDVLIYLDAHRTQPASFLKAQSWTTLHTPPYGGDYAMGWVTAADGRLWHNGSNKRWYAEIGINGARTAVAAAAANLGNMSSTRPAISAALGSAFMSAAAETHS